MKKLTQMEIAARLNGSVARHAVPLAAFMLLTLLFTHPFVCPWKLGAAPILGSDPGLTMWTLAWVNHAILNQPLDLFAANAFFPYPGSLSYSEHGFGAAILVQPWSWFSGNPVIPYNLLLLLAYFGSAVGMYVLAYHYTESRWSAFIAGLIFGFGFFRTHHFGHLTLISTACFPLSIWLFLLLRERFRWSLAMLWVALTALQCLTNWYVAAMLFLTLAVVALFQYTRPPRQLSELLCLAVCVILVGAILWPFARPYLGRSSQANLQENAAFATDAAGYVEPPYNTVLGRFLDNRQRWIWGERTVYVGFPALLLGLCGIALAPNSRRTWTWVAVALIGFLFSLGPGDPPAGNPLLPLGYVYKAIPALSSLRATARFALLVTFATALLAALATARYPRRRGWLLVPVFVLVLDYYPVGLPFSACRAEVFSPRPVDRWLLEHNVPLSGPPGFRTPKQRDRKTLVELPDYSGTSDWPRESLYMLYSTQHWMNLVNGYTRFYPPGYVDDFRAYSQFPAAPAVTRMKERNVDFVVVHLGEYPLEAKSRLLEDPSLQTCFGDDCVFSVAQAASDQAQGREAQIGIKTTE